jgi:pimeloyl-ACP methyl ester carboxylesterase
MRAGTVSSADGTVIGYNSLGQGPAVLLLHGGMQASQNLRKLAQALSRDFTLHVPDRRGRGMSGPHGGQYGIARECEDVAALAAQTGAARIFGLSSGAVIALRSALLLPGLRKVALYEPPLSVNHSSPLGWVARYEGEIARGDLPAAFVTAMKGVQASRLTDLLPRFLLVAFARLALKAEQKSGGGDVPIATLIPTMGYDARIVRETETDLAEFRALKAEVLLLGGSKSPGYLRFALDALAGALPHMRREEFRGLGHTGPDNDGDPARVAAELCRFFA